MTIRLRGEISVYIERPGAAGQRVERPAGTIFASEGKWFVGGPALGSKSRPCGSVEDGVRIIREAWLFANLRGAGI